jgi:hypothetical protein
MVKNSNSAAATRKASPTKARQSRPIPRTRETSEASPARKMGTHAPGKSSPDSAPRPKETVERNFTFYANPTLALICLPSGAAAQFSLDDAAHLTGVHVEMLRYYSRVGLIDSRRGFLETDLFFDKDALHEISRIEHYRQHLGIGLRALPLICELRRASERLQIELRFLSYP